MRGVSGVFVGALLAVGLSACIVSHSHKSHGGEASSVPAAPPPQGPDWQQLDALCQGGGMNDPERCSFVSAVKEVTGPNATYSGIRLSNFAGTQGLHDLAGLEARTNQGCAEGYQRACVAARLTKLWTKLVAARSLAGRNPAVQTEYNLAVQALAKQAIKVSATTGEAVAGPDFEGAEPHAEAALAAAKAVVEAAKDAPTNAEAEKTRHSANLAGEKECEADVTGCEAACTADPTSDKCWLLALLHCTTAPDGACLPHWSKVASTDLSKARELAGRSCKAGNAQGCTVSAGLENMVTARTEGLWSTVVGVADDLTQKEYAVTVAKQWGAAQPRLQRQLPQIVAMNQAIVRDQYCPAKKAFIHGVSLAEFQRRATAHCQTAAPLGQGVSGAQVTLTSECTTVYAISCP
jgi:hypothetical protein